MHYAEVNLKNDLSQTDATAIARPHQGRNSRQQILVVEDDRTVRRINTEVLTYSGYLVDAVEDGAAAWEALQQKNYDLVVTDNVMPKVTGVGLLKKIQAARMDLPVIMATGSQPDEELVLSQVQPPAMMLLKPYTFEELLWAVKSVLRAATAALGDMAPPPNWPAQPRQSPMNVNGCPAE